MSRITLAHHSTVPWKNSIRHGLVGLRVSPSQSPSRHTRTIRLDHRANQGGATSVTKWWRQHFAILECVFNARTLLPDPNVGRWIMTLEKQNSSCPTPCGRFALETMSAHPHIPDGRAEGVRIIQHMVAERAMPVSAVGDQTVELPLLRVPFLVRGEGTGEYGRPC
jgi:hypothetical protein